MVHVALAFIMAVTGENIASPDYETAFAKAQKENKEVRENFKIINKFF